MDITFQMLSVNLYMFFYIRNISISFVKKYIIDRKKGLMRGFFKDEDC